MVPKSLRKTFLGVDLHLGSEKGFIYNCKFSKVNPLRKVRSGAYTQVLTEQDTNSSAAFKEAGVILRHMAFRRATVIEFGFVCGPGEVGWSGLHWQFLVPG